VSDIAYPRLIQFSANVRLQNIIVTLNLTFATHSIKPVAKMSWFLNSMHFRTESIKTTMSLSPRKHGFLCTGATELMTPLPQQENCS